MKILGPDDDAGERPELVQDLDHPVEARVGEDHVDLAAETGSPEGRADDRFRLDIGQDPAARVVVEHRPDARVGRDLRLRDEQPPRRGVGVASGASGDVPQRAIEDDLVRVGLVEDAGAVIPEAERAVLGLRIGHEGPGDEVGEGLGIARVDLPELLDDPQALAR